MTADPRALVFAGACLLLIVMVGVVVVLSDQPATRAAHQTEYAPPLAEKMAGTGSYIVGKHVKAGTYRTEGGPRCTWVRLADLRREPSSILDRGTATGRTSVDLVTGVLGFETNGCPEWVMVR